MERTPVVGKCKLTLRITVETCKGPVHQEYVVTNQYPDSRVADPAWRITKDNGEHYDVRVADGYAVCDCPDFDYARDGKDPKGCKHIAAMRSVGLLRRGL